MNPNDTRPGTDVQLTYREDRCGARWPLGFNAVLGWVLMIGFGIAMNIPHLSGLVIIAVGGGLLGVCMTAVLGFGMHIGIRAGHNGIQIGGMNYRDRRIRKEKWPPRKPLKAIEFDKAVFTCPWEGVRSVYLLTGKDEIRRIRRDLKKFQRATPAPRIPIGVLYQTWFVKAELVITHNATDATSDPAEFRTAWAQYGRIRPVESPTWMIPTRNPDALRAALEQIPGAPPVQNALPPEAVFQFRSG